MCFSERMEELKCRIEDEIQKLFRDREPASLYQPMVHLLDGGGKRIRPLLLILSCRAVGGRLEDCIDAALAVEILHTFTLVHDDIMDHDDIRRGRPTVHKKWDEPTAILAGDGLVTLAYQTLLKIKHPRLIAVLKTFTEGLLALCEGQTLDKEFETRNDVSIDAYDEMIGKKTAKLMEVACEIGAILGNGVEEERIALKQFATSLGKAFQIQDDLLDILSEEKVSGKPLGSDLTERKKTYLTIHFLNNATSSEKEHFLRLWGRNSMERRVVLQVKGLFEKVGTFQAAQRAVEGLISTALRNLDLLKSGEAKEDLRRLVFRIQERIS
jgi:geranylgeranyl pyrophosphate synthase